jgi:hypothetical protein
MKIGLIVLGGVLIAIAAALFVLLQFQKGHNQKTESFISLGVMVLGAAGIMVMISGIYP